MDLSVVSGELKVTGLLKEERTGDGLGFSGGLGGEEEEGTEEEGTETGLGGDKGEELEAGSGEGSCAVSTQTGREEVTV